MFDLSHYLNTDNQVFSSFPIEFTYIYFIFLIVVSLINITIFIKSYSSLKNFEFAKNFGLNYLILTMIGVVVWPIGELIYIFVYIFSGFQYSVLSNLDNLPLAIGLFIAIVFFSQYIQNMLGNMKYKNREIIFAKTFYSFLILTSLIIILLLILRFIMLGLEPGNLVSYIITILLLSLLVIINFILIFFIGFRLYNERKIFQSKIKQVRISFYLAYYGILFVTLLNIVLSLLATEFLGLEILFYFLPYITFGNSTLAMIFLYYGLFLPNWVRKRAGLQVIE